MTGVPDHSHAYRIRRVTNWFPLGLTYATFYMGRYNFNVFKGQFGEMFHFDKAQVGIIATAGFWITISIGYTLALTVGGFLLAHFPYPVIFIAPAGALLVMAVIDYFVVSDTPGKAGHPDFDTGDASSGDETPVDLKYVFNKVFTNPVMLTLAAAEFCTGFVRQGLLLYYTEFLGEVHAIKVGSTLFSLASTGVTVGGIIGGLLCGWLSDRFFQSRRAPVAFIFYFGQALSLVALGLTHNALLAAGLIGFSCIWIFGVHGMLSGTASADFGGKKAAASATGMLDGVQYVASGFTGFGLGWALKTWGWGIWTASIVPFSLVGAAVISRLWNARPRGAQ